MNDTTREKQGLILITMGIVAALTTIAGMAIFHDMKSEAATVIGVIAGGLIAFGKDIVAALRGYSMSAQLSKVTDQLAASTPGGTAAPADAADAAAQVADAANTQADRIAGQAEKEA